MADTGFPDFSDDVSIRHWLSRMEFEDQAISDRIDMNYNDLHKAVLDGNVESCIQILERRAIGIDEANAKGDTALHMASRNECRNPEVIFDILISAGGNINARNKWHQTPLHYAAIAQSLQNMQILINTPKIDMNAVDVNGYNALHYFIASSAGGDTWDSTESLEIQLPEELRRGISLLINAGTEVNRQTKYGYSIIHLAATRNDNTPLIKYILLNYPEIDMKLKNKMEETFLHVYVGAEIFEEIMETFEHIAKNSKMKLKELLNMKNGLGRTSWEIMIDNVNISSRCLQKILQYGVFVRGADNFGNTALHRIAGVSSSIVTCDIMETLIVGGVDLAAVNIYGELPASVVFLEPIFDLFLQYNMNFNSLDRWGRSPLVSIMKHRPIPNLLENLIKKTKVDVNTTDIYGSTPLHFAAYHNYPEQIELLIRHGANIGVVDSLNDSPLDTVGRHCSFHCYELLQTKGRLVEVLYRRRTKFQEFQQILLHVPKKIKITDIKGPDEKQNILNLPEPFDEFMDFLLTSYYDRSPENREEVDNIIAEVNRLVESLCRKIVNYDSRFKITVFPTGSSAEGTKVGRPDEFDFVLCLDKLDEICDIIITEKCLATNFACLKFKDIPEKNDYLSFSDLDGYFLAFPFLQYLFRYLRKALNETDIWKSGNLYCNFEDKIVVIKGKPVFNFDVYWIGAVYKQLKISIDLVPAVYKKGWWPPNISLNDIPLMNENIKEAGCFLLLQTKSNEFDKKKHTLNDSINNTCNVNEDNNTLIQKRMLRVSAAPAEICLMKSLPEKFRRGYALAKIVKGKEVCPEIEINELPTNLLSRQLKFQSKTTLPVKSSSFVKSYMLKNCIFKTYQDTETDFPSGETLKIAEIAAKAYGHLFNFIDKRELKPYFLPYTDVFEPEKAEQRSTYDDFMLQLKREFSIKLILRILNHPFSEVCLASKTELYRW